MFHLFLFFLRQNTSFAERRFPCIWTTHFWSVIFCKFLSFLGKIKFEPFFDARVRALVLTVGGVACSHIVPPILTVKNKEADCAKFQCNESRYNFYFALSVISWAFLDRNNCIPIVCVMQNSFCVTRWSCTTTIALGRRHVGEAGRQAWKFSLTFNWSCKTFLFRLYLQLECQWRGSWRQ